MEPRILRLPEVMRLTQLSRSTILLKIKHGEFPPPFKLSKGINAWERAAVDQWIDDTLREAKRLSATG